MMIIGNYYSNCGCLAMDNFDVCNCLGTECSSRHPIYIHMKNEAVMCFRLNNGGNNCHLNRDQPNDIPVHYSSYIGKLQNGQGIAVARIYINDAYGRFINEASTLLKLEHENLAKFLGYCIKETRLFLVYDFALPAMFDPVSTLLNWDKRYKIILGVARALLYLHREAPTQIIHCDVKPGNILLDKKLNPILLGFLNTRYLDINQTDMHVIFDPWLVPKNYHFQSHAHLLKSSSNFIFLSNESVASNKWSKVHRQVAH
uniref:non-specific serine/threonine protein kinase n=1 Tax=Helianthus annuus TaxID=4232 RepID=A0A251SZT2_HELAN